MANSAFEPWGEAGSEPSSSSKRSGQGRKLDKNEFEPFVVSGHGAAKRQRVDKKAELNDSQLAQLKNRTAHRV